MKRFTAFCIAGVMALSACAGPVVEPQIGPDGQPLPQVYRIRGESRVQYGMLDSVNALREASGVQKLELNAQLNAAAATHARDMALQNRPWHFGSDGSSPIDRVQRVGYMGRLVGENISETYESETETLAAWMENEQTRNTILAPEATDLGFAWEQEPNGKIWWTLVTGASGMASSDLPSS